MAKALVLLLTIGMAMPALCPKVPETKKMHLTQPKVGHYGVFNGSRFRKGIQPKIRDFIRAHRGKA